MLHECEVSEPVSVWVTVADNDSDSDNNSDSDSNSKNNSNSNRNSYNNMFIYCLALSYKRTA